MSHVMNFLLKSNGIKSESVSLDDWPIITDNNIESTNFLFEKSNERIEKLERLIKENDVVLIGGFIGMTEDGDIFYYINYKAVNWFARTISESIGTGIPEIGGSVGGCWEIVLDGLDKSKKETQEG